MAPTIPLRIQDEADVQRGIAILQGREHVETGTTLLFSFFKSGCEYCSFLPCVLCCGDSFVSERKVYSLGNIAITNHIAPALSSSSAAIHICFVYCNLSKAALGVLYDALRNNTSLIGFTEDGNPGTDKEVSKRAVIATRAPLKIYNAAPLSAELTAARLRSMQGGGSAPTPAPVQHHLTRQEEGELEAQRKAMAALQAARNAVVTGASAGQQQLGGGKKHFAFISYVKTESLSETKIVHDFLSNKYPGRSMFRDTEQHFTLDALITNVSNTANVLVFLTPSYVKRPYTLLEIVYALRNGVNVVTVKIRRPGLLMFDFEALNQALQTTEQLQDFIDPSVWSILAENRLYVEDVRTALKRVVNVKAFTLDMDEPKRVLDAQLEAICEGLR